MNTKNTASQPKVASIGDDAQFRKLADAYRCALPDHVHGPYLNLANFIDSKLRAPADQAASVHPMAAKVDCGACDGTGAGKTCTDCNGTGFHWEPIEAAAEGQVSAAAPAGLANLPGWRDKLRWSKANLDMHGYIAFTPAQLEHFVSMLADGFCASEGQAQTSAAVEEFDDFPEFSERGMGCGLEDRGITDRYDAMRYGWDEAIDAVAERIKFYNCTPLTVTPVAAQSADKPAKEQQ